MLQHSEIRRAEPAGTMLFQSTPKPLAEIQFRCIRRGKPAGVRVCSVTPHDSRNRLAVFTSDRHCPASLIDMFEVYLFVELERQDGNETLYTSVQCFLS